MSEENVLDHLYRRIEQRRASIGVIGLGYAGLPLAVEFARAGFHVTGFDIDGERVDALNAGICHIADVDGAAFQAALGTTFQATGRFEQLAGMDVVTICVPTPLGKNREPDFSHIMSAAEQVARYLRQGQLIVLESTIFPGASEELLLPLFELRGLHTGRDYSLAYSPERIDPGNRRFSLRATPKIVGGVTGQCARLASALYSTIVARVVPVSSSRAAELVKLLENTFRAVNIGLANEFAQIADTLDVDIWEVIEAASTKPYGFMPFYPGPGPGGHCIPIDPLYLSWKLRALDYRARFIELANEANQAMPAYVVDLVARALNENGKCLDGARILVLGVAYKRDVGDVRESVALDVMRLLLERHAHCSYVDRNIPTLRLGEALLHALPLDDDALRAADCVLILTDHTHVDYRQVIQQARLIVDTRNATGSLSGAEHVWRLARPSKTDIAITERGAT
jgi:UDP-N-acetyl-D-glucosamine dehydrogenase